MKIYPAIDILSGNAVRLKQGRLDDVTIYGDPVEIARNWARAGTCWLHVVDLDGAVEGEPKNLDVLKKIANALAGKVKVQFGGGIRTIETLAAVFATGIERVVLGTAAVENQKFVKEALRGYAGRVAIGVDSHDGMAKVSGWTRESSIRAIDLAQRLEYLGASLVIYTDIARDGVLEGPNVEATLGIIENTGLFVIASGGISSIEDIAKFGSLHHPRLEGVIIGKALYDGRFQLEEALACAR